jgi:hypothetical protein
MTATAAVGGRIETEARRATAHGRPGWTHAGTALAVLTAGALPGTVSERTHVNPPLTVIPQLRQNASVHCPLQSSLLEPVGLAGPQT